MKKNAKKNETESKSKGKAAKEKSPEDPKENDQNKKEQNEQRGKSKKKNNKEEDSKKKEDAKKQEEKKVLAKYNLDFIYRREKYTLKNLVENMLVSRIKLLIGKKIEIDTKDLKFYYKDKELKEEDNKTNVYEMIKGDNVPFIEVKKESPNNENIISLNTKVNLIYKVKCKPVSSYVDLVNKIEQFFRDICLEKNFLCEPTAKDSYDVCFSCSDHCFQFKRYMMNISRTDKLYEKTKFEILKVDKSKVIEPKIDKKEEEEEVGNKVETLLVKDKKTKKEINIEYKKMKHRENDYFQKDFINSGPYESYEEIKKKSEKGDKKKWIGKKNFSAI
jgi:hypothetical protein